jgi:hypothetical protein
MHQVWRLSDYCEGNLGVCFTDDGLFLGRTPLIERQGTRFAVRGRTEIERLLSRAYGSDLAVDRLLPGLATVHEAVNGAYLRDSQNPNMNMYQWLQTQPYDVQREEGLKILRELHILK